MKKSLFILSVAYIFIIFSPVCFAQSHLSSYDPYQTDEQSTTIREKSTVEKISDFPVYVIHGIKKGVKKGVIWIEKYHVADKVTHVYEEITLRGVYPLFIDTGDRHANAPGYEASYGVYQSEEPNGGVFFNPLKIQYRKEFFEHDDNVLNGLGLNTWVNQSLVRYRDVGLILSLPENDERPVYTQCTLRYQDFPCEDFFGLGSKGSIADGGAFSLEESSVAFELGRAVSDALSVELGGVFSHVNVYDGKDNKKKPISNFALDGRNGGKLAGVGVALEYDVRDSIIDPHTGGFARAQAGYYQGIDGDSFGYAKYRFDVAKYIPIGKKSPLFYYDSVVALRLMGEVNDSVNNGKIPFYDLARLGGQSSLRGYQHNRFFDEMSLLSSIEYRYNIWQCKDMKVDAALFYDGGWVFESPSAFEFDEYKYSYGIGFRYVTPHVVFKLEAGHSSEGTEWYVTVRPIF